MGLSSGYIAVLVLALYISSSTVAAMYARPVLLWFVCPLMLYWISRIWLLAHRGLIDEHKSRLGSGVVLLIADAGGKAAAACGVTDDLTDRISAVDAVRAAAEALGGKGGGGRPDMAQAGGADPSKAPEAIAAVEALLSA